MIYSVKNGSVKNCEDYTGNIFVANRIDFKELYFFVFFLSNLLTNDYFLAFLYRAKIKRMYYIGDKFDEMFKMSK